MNRNTRLIIAATTFLIVSLLLWVSLTGSHLSGIPIGINSEKEIHNALYGPQQGEIIDTRHSAFGQTDLVRYEDIHYMDIFIDGTAGTPMYRFNGNFDNPNSIVDNLKTTFPGYFPFMFLKEKERNSALIIGPGGGRDILLTVMGGVREITAIEVNKDLVDMVKEYSWYNGGIYTSLDHVSIIIDEGRSFLKRQEKKFDIIMLSLPVTNTSRSIEGYSVTESFLLTEESISDYLDHLTEEGRLMIIAHGDLSMLRLLSLSLSALNDRGVSNVEAMKRVYLVGSDQYPLFVLKKRQFEVSDSFARYNNAINKLGYDPSASYFPYLNQRGSLNPALEALESGEMAFDDLEKKVRKMGYDISLVTDNSPFFYKFEQGLPEPVLTVLWSSIILTLLAVLGPLLYWRKKFFLKGKREKYTNNFGWILFRCIILFFMLGAGFMLTEISLAQRFVLFLGQPVLALAVLLFSLLTGAGMGSICSGRLTSKMTMKGIAVSALVIAGVLLIYNFLLSYVFAQLLGMSLLIRMLASVITLAVLGFAMGFPFPLSIRLLKEIEMVNCIPWMWGINGISSVLGSALTVAIAISIGFNEALISGAGCYFIVFLMFNEWGRKKRNRKELPVFREV